MKTITRLTAHSRSESEAPRQLTLPIDAFACEFDYYGPIISFPVPTDWMRDAACATEPASGLPWTEDRVQVSERERIQMAAVCKGCPARISCGIFARCARVTAGFWAGQDRDNSRTYKRKAS